MSSCEEKTRSLAGVNVDVAAKLWAAALTVKHVIVAVEARLKFDLDVHLLVRVSLREFQRSCFFPDPKGLCNGLVHFFFREAFWVFCYLVGEVLGLPARSLQDVTFPSFQSDG